MIVLFAGAVAGAVVAAVATPGTPEPRRRRALTPSRLMPIGTPVTVR